MTCVGRGPVAKPPVMGPAAGTWRGSQTALSEPPTGGCHDLLVGGALCRAEPSNIWLLARLEGAASEEAAPHTVACSMRRPGHGAWREQLRCPRFSSARDGSTRGRGMGGQGVGDRAANPPPPPRGCTSRPCVDAGYCPDPGPLTGNVRGRRCAAPRPHGIPYHTIPYHTIPYHTIPYHTIPYHTIPYHTIPYHTIPYHTIPYHTIPYPPPPLQGPQPMPSHCPPDAKCRPHRHL